MTDRTRAGLRRKAGNAPSKIRIVVVAYDGEKTEHEYFSGWRSLIGNKGIVFKPLYVNSGGNVFSAVVEAGKVAKSDNTFDDFWCVCDLDDTSGRQLTDARGVARKNGIKLCISNRCFEVWLALLWGMISSSPILNEKQAVALVSQHHEKYTIRNKHVPFSVLLPLTEAACANAVSVRERGLDNPYTDVDLLISELIGLRK